MVDKHRVGLNPDSDAAEALAVMDGPQDKHATDELLRICELYREIIKGYAEKVIKGGKSSGMKRLKQPLIKTKRELMSEAPAQLMPTEKDMYVLDIDASVVATSGILH